MCRWASFSQTLQTPETLPAQDRKGHGNKELAVGMAREQELSTQGGWHKGWRRTWGVTTWESFMAHLAAAVTCPHWSTNGLSSIELRQAFTSMWCLSSPEQNFGWTSSCCFLLLPPSMSHPLPIFSCFPVTVLLLIHAVTANSIGDGKGQEVSRVWRWSVSNQHFCTGAWQQMHLQGQGSVEIRSQRTVYCSAG